MNSMQAEVESLPALIDHVVVAAREELERVPAAVLARVRRIVVAGSGDSFFAGLATRTATERVAGVPVETMTSFHGARFATHGLRAGDPPTTLVVGVSVSGSTTQAIDAVTAAREAGTTTLALTARPDSRIGAAADHALVVAGPPWHDPEVNTTPGVRSWAVNVVALLMLGAAVGAARRHVDAQAHRAFVRSVEGLAAAVGETTALCAEPARALAERLVHLSDADVLGGGPNVATAHFTAAKLLEACGDRAVGQDLEEWAHLQFYTRSNDVLTAVVSGGGRDLERAAEILGVAARIGRPTVGIVPASHAAAVEADAYLHYASGVEEVLTPLPAAVPGEIYAAHRAALLGETYFRVDRPITVSRIRSASPAGR